MTKRWIPQLFEHQDPTPSEPCPIPLIIHQFLTEYATGEGLTELACFPRFSSELKGFYQDEEGFLPRFFALMVMKQFKCVILLIQASGVVLCGMVLKLNFLEKY